MDRTMSGRMDFLALACRRYPGEDPEVAMLFMRSDRQRAGLGALDERKRGIFKKQVQRSKHVDQSDVLYHLAVNRPARREFPAQELEDLDLSVTKSLTVTLVSVPVVNKVIRVRVNQRDVYDQSGRGGVARMLLHARAQLADAVRSAK
jgi:hypothetical protein